MIRIEFGAPMRSITAIVVNGEGQVIGMCGEDNEGQRVELSWSPIDIARSRTAVREENRHYTGDFTYKEKSYDQE